MARSIHRLTVAQERKAAREGRTVPDGGGLYLQRGSSWIYRFARDGKECWVGLGPLLTVDLPTARAKAAAQQVNSR